MIPGAGELDCARGNIETEAGMKFGDAVERLGNAAIGPKLEKKMDASMSVPGGHP